MKLENKMGVIIDGKWKIPEVGKANIDCIRRADGSKVLGLVKVGNIFEVQPMDEIKPKQSAYRTYETALRQTNEHVNVIQKWSFSGLSLETRKIKSDFWVRKWDL